MSLFSSKDLTSAVSDPQTGWFLTRTGEMPELGVTVAGLNELWCVIPNEKKQPWLQSVVGSLWLEPEKLTQELLCWVGEEVGTLWEGSPFFQTVAEHRAAVVLFPLVDHANAHGRLMRLWLVRGAGLAIDHRDKLDGAEAFLTGRPGMQLFLDPLPDQKISGHSWQLAAHLAARVLNESRAGIARKLARDWIITGAVDDQHCVTPVELGNKLTLPCITPGRQWMLPSKTNPSDEFRREARSGLAFVDRVDTAWQVLTGERTLEEDAPQLWPTRLEMHTLVSSALRPQLLAVMLARPKKLVLWVSREMEGVASLLRQVLDECKARGLECGEVLQRTITANHIRKAEDELRKEGLDRTGQRVLLHVTGGNLLMRYAAASLAQINPELTLVYRDVDTTKIEEKLSAADPSRYTTFTTLRYANRQGITGVFSGAKIYSGASYTSLVARSEPEDDWQRLSGFFREKPRQPGKRNPMAD